LAITHFSRAKQQQTIFIELALLMTLSSWRRDAASVTREEMQAKWTMVDTAGPTLFACGRF